MLTIDKPAKYRIQVVGNLDENWSNRLGGMEVSSSSQEGVRIVTTLTGVVIDQAGLLGMLNLLYDLRMPLLSVECLDVR